ncbi:MAG: DUF3574 domain-containing protein [Oscillatoriales cyanobacterium C42_A2020_001]|nr:DUF3574 domain-containing protein [Leptolyngbyaceae cyanobacterium C42_A2020_001]
MMMIAIAESAIASPALVQQDLYFGLSLSNNKTISRPEFQDFLDDVITPRFASGLTQFDGKGQLPEQSGVQEATNVVSLYAPDTLENQLSLKQIARAYQQAFDISVVQVTNKDDLKIGFGPGENLIDNDPIPELIQVDLFFGRNIGGTVGVTQEQFQAFVDQTITPRFPLGLTNFDANGQFLSSDGTLVREPAEVVSLIIEDTEANEAAIDAIVSEYKQQFQQESVLIAVNEAITVAFGPTADLIDNDLIPEPIQVDLFFGRNMGGVEGVSEAEFQTFLQDVVDPYFDQFTVLDADGQFLSNTGDLIRERSKTVSLIIEDTVANEAAINHVVSEYIARFQQESVLVVVDEEIQVNFINNLPIGCGDGFREMGYNNLPYPPFASGQPFRVEDCFGSGDRNFNALWSGLM